MVINELPVGSIVRLGRYSLPHRSDDVFDIDWIKASKQNDFISQKVLLGMQFDAMEGWNANSDYALSNIRQFMNSEEHSWYHPTHPNDCGPSTVMLDSYIVVRTSNYSGLLSRFTDEEVNILGVSGTDRLRLPTVEEINGGFPYFKRYGRRAHPISVYGELEYNDFKEGMFSRYYMLRNGSNSVFEMDRSGCINQISPAKYSGVRPVCKIKVNAEVKQTGKNTYEMNLSSTTPVRFFKETQSLDWLLGI